MGEPYNPCVKDINSDTSLWVENILSQNISYRQKTCHYLCLNEYTSERNISKKLTNTELRFNYQGNCSEYCPLECEKNIYEVKESAYMINYDILWMYFFYYDNT